MSIFDVRHQPRAQRIIQRALASGRLPHAHLFHGPDGVGKEMLAGRLARVLLCERPVRPERAPLEELAGFDGSLLDACGECQDCVLARAGTHPDLHLIHRELHIYHPDAAVRNRKGLDLGVDVIRRFVIDAVSTKPTRGRAKVFVIREADRITHSAQSALLKTLEEPPGTTFLVLLTASLDKLLSTTRSRCQAVPFGPLPTEFVAAGLSKLVADLTLERAAMYAAMAQGSLGLAQRFCEDGLESYNEKIVESLSRLGAMPATRIAKHWLDDAKALGAQFRDRDQEISDTEAQRRGLKTLLSLVGTWFGDVLRLSVDSGAGVVNTAYARQLARAGIGPRQAALAINAIVETERHIERNASTQLAVEALVIRLVRIAAAARA